jgi:hypothetical protein
MVCGSGRADRSAVDHAIGKCPAGAAAPGMDLAGAGVVGDGEPGAAAEHSADGVFGTAPLRQLGPVWVGGFLLTVLAGSGAGLRLLVNGEPAFFAWLAGALFIPSLALALGIWSGGSRLFEIVYLLFWYIGPMNKTPALDYMGALDETLARGIPAA